jgi:hypothetical protein
MAVKGFMKKTTEAIVIKLFMIVINEFSKYARAFDRGKPFQHGLMLGGKAGAYPIEAPFRCSTLG